MKNKLNNKDLEIVSGGFLSRGMDGSYVVYGRSDKGIRMMVNYAEDFMSAVKEDYESFKEQYKKLGIISLEELEEYYNYGDFISTKKFR